MNRLRNVTRIKGAKNSRLKATIFVATFALLGCILLFVTHAATPTASLEAETNATGTATTGSDSGASGGSYLQFGSSTTTSCTVTALLVNPCRPIYGTAMATLTPYPQVASDQVSQMQYQDQRIGHTSDIAHTYNSPGHNVLTAADKTFISDGYTLMLNWKPASPWNTGYNAACTSSAVQTSSTPNACDSGAADDSAIDAMAASLKSEASHKIMLVIWHEPENDVTPGGADCTVAKGSSGTATDYVNMWRYTENRLQAIDGVNNVVYVEYFQNYPPLLCNNINQLYAGDNYVDWIMFDAYVDYGTWGSALSWDSTVGGPTRMYTFLTQNSNSSHNYLSKPWGISEFGITKEGTANEETWYGQIATAITANTFPNLKAYIYFDDNNPADNNGAGNEYRQAYDDSEAFSQPKQDAYNGLVNAIYNFKQ